MTSASTAATSSASSAASTSQPEMNPDMIDLFTKLRRWNDKHGAHGELAHMNVRMLADVGVDRGDTYRVAFGAR